LVKEKTAIWARDRRKVNDQILKDIELELEQTYVVNVGVFLSNYDMERSRYLETLRTKISNDNEKTWSLKCRAIWIVVGGQSTIFFQNFVNHWKNYNTIRELSDEYGSKVRGFAYLVSLGVKHFETMFKEPK
jgi:hypothetical protein